MPTSRISRLAAIPVLIVVVVVAVPLLLVALAPMTLVGPIERYVRSEAGFETSLRHLRVTLFPLEVEVGGLVLRNPDPAFEEPLLAADHLRVEINVRRYLQGSPAWWRGWARGIDLRVARVGRGNSNWDAPAAAEEPESARDNALLQFDSVRIADLALQVVAEQERHLFEVARLELDKDDHQRLTIGLQGRYADEPMAAAGVLALPHPQRSSEVAFRADLFGGELMVDGVIGHDGVTPGVVRFRAAFADLSAVGLLLGEDLQALEPLLLQGEIVSPESGRWQVSARGEIGGDPVEVTGRWVQPDGARAGELVARARLFGGEVEVAGPVEAGLVPREAQFRVELTDLSTVAALTVEGLEELQPVDLTGELAMPAPGRWRIDSRGVLAGLPLEVSTELAVTDELYQLQHLDLTLGDTELQATGELGLEERRVAARLTAARIDVDQLPLDRWLEAPDPAPRALHELAAALPVEEIERWSVDLGARIGRLDYAGTRLNRLEIDLGRREEALLLDLRLAALRRATAENAWELTEPVWVAARLSGAGRTPAVPKVGLRFATAGIEGDLSAVLPVTAEGSLEASVRAEATSTEAVKGLELARFEPLLPFRAELEAAREGAVWRIDPMDLSVAGEPAGGRLLIDPEAEPILIRGELHARAIDLRRLVDVEEVAEEVETEAEEAEARDAPLFAGDPLDWGWLDAATVDVRARVERLTVRPVTFLNVRAQAQMRDGVLVVDPVEADLLDGTVRSRMRARRLGGGGGFDVRLLARGLAPADLGVEEELIRGGATSLHLDLNMRGESARALAASLNGELALEVRQATIESELIDVLGSDVVAEAVRYISPFSDREERTELRCAAAHVMAVDGVLVSSDHIVMETDNVTVRASALVDLHDESLQINFEPEAREDVEIGIADVADLVQVRGAITDPEVEVDPEGVLGAVATAGAAVATAGASLLVQALFEDDDEGTPCRSVFVAQPADHDLEDLDEQLD